MDRVQNKVSSTTCYSLDRSNIIITNIGEDWKGGQEVFALPPEDRCRTDSWDYGLYPA